MKRKIKRGDVFLCQISGAVGSEQDGTRPVVILQNNTGNQHSTTTIAAMITSQRKRELPVHVVAVQDSGAHLCIYADGGLFAVPAALSAEIVDADLLPFFICNAQIHLRFVLHPVTAKPESLRQKCVPRMPSAQALDFFAAGVLLHALCKNHVTFYAEHPQNSVCIQTELLLQGDGRGGDHDLAAVFLILHQRRHQIRKRLADADLGFHGNPTLLDVNGTESIYTPTPEITRQQNEINRMMYSPQIDAERIKTEIYKLAQMKYDACTFSDAPQKTELLRSMLAEKGQQEMLDTALLTQAVRRITVSHTCVIEVEFINGIVIQNLTERGEKT